MSKRRSTRDSNQPREAMYPARLKDISSGVIAEGASKIFVQCREIMKYISMEKMENVDNMEVNNVNVNNPIFDSQLESRVEYSVI